MCDFQLSLLEISAVHRALRCSA